VGEDGLVGRRRAAGGGSHSATRATTAATTALAVKASLNPAVASTPPAWPLDAAMVETKATPSAAPSSWQVLSSPEVIPAWRGSICAIAVVVAVTSAAPRPAAAMR
jgi:hypothetical protein